MSGSTGLQGPFQEHTRVRKHRILHTENAGTSPGSPVVPELDAYVTADGISARVWCAWCVRWHSHGHCGPHEPLGAGNGHRVAHCHDPRSPYNSTGYTIREVGWWDHRPDWRQLPVICRPCGDAFYRDHSAARYCSEPCRRQAKAAA